jgi:hypothetical protein
MTAFRRFAIVVAGVTAMTAKTGAEEVPAPIHIAVLGVYHMANPGRDVVNAEVDDVRLPGRQRELEILAGQLAAFAPTKIGVEHETKGPGFTVPQYESYAEKMLTEEKNEMYQVGFRLAKKLGHTAVYGFDEGGGAGEPDYFPFEKVKSFATNHGQQPILDGIFTSIGVWLEEFQREQKTATVSALLAKMNDPALTIAEHKLAYNGMLAVGDGDNQPGAELAAYWFMRNAKMFAKVLRFAKPGDRVLLIVGAGHRYWLTQLAASTPGVVHVEIQPFLTAVPASTR